MIVSSVMVRATMMLQFTFALIGLATKRADKVSLRGHKCCSPTNDDSRVANDSGGNEFYNKMNEPLTGALGHSAAVHYFPIDSLLPLDSVYLLLFRISTSQRLHLSGLCNRSLRAAQWSLSRGASRPVTSRGTMPYLSPSKSEFVFRIQHNIRIYRVKVRHQGGVGRVDRRVANQFIAFASHLHRIWMALRGWPVVSVSPN